MFCPQCGEVMAPGPLDLRRPDPGERAGEAVKRRGWLGRLVGRFTRLMAARGDAFRDQLVLAARLLASKQIPIHWGDLGDLLLAEDIDEERAATLRFRIAQSYFRALRKQDQPAKSA